MSKKHTSAVIFLLIILLTSCAHKTDVSNCLPYSNNLPGFWSGTWHGIIMVPAFFGSLFWNDIVVYAVNNNGHWYDFGFVGGFFMFTRFIARLLKS